jgi:glycerol-3-phosphate dehydrogenase (NAD(P)+)
MTAIAVLGAGAFGTVWAKILAERGHAVALWVRGTDAADRIAAARESSHLPGVPIPDAVTVTADLAAAVAGKAIVLGVTPSHAVREVFSAAAPALAADAVVVNASKGIEQGTLATIADIYREVLGDECAARAAYLSGPTFAKELAAGLPAAIVVASHDAASARMVQEAFAIATLRVYTTDDVIGIELGGALKNVIAIGAGIADGLGYGHNTRAMMMTRGLAEIARLGVKMGANPLTFAGLAGMGDLVLTCTGDLSRNRHVGVQLGRGRRIEEILGEMSAVAEGVRTAKSAHDLGVRHEVDLPIIDAIFAVLYEGKSPGDAVADLLRREPRQERG